MEWPVTSQSYELLGKIGQGAFASVWKAVVKDETDRECSVKVLNLDHVDTNLAEIRLEVQAMRLSSHENVLACHTSFVHDKELWLVTQLMRKGSSLYCLQAARRILRSEGRQGLPMEGHITYILHETLLGLQYLHENGQIHRDVKASNILLDGNGDVRIADFGVSGWLVHGGARQEKAKTFVGTPCWMAPEVMEQVHGYDYKADIWSLGITAMELAKGYAPYGRYPPMKVLILTIQEDPPTLATYDDYDIDDDEDGVVEEEWSKSFHNLISLCLQKDPSKRPTTDELLQSKYFTSMNREERRAKLKSEICDLVPDVGGTKSPKVSPSKALPGNSKISVVLKQAEEDRPAGTTWVFADGSQVMASTSKQEESVDDVMDQLETFGNATGGEGYKRDGAGAEARPNSDRKVLATPTARADADDGLDDFLDEFEKTTGGENFRQPNV
eukprot:CAMPEP_0194044514 /NCGR_PEP_ID=MMETSP0009_2-20130614/15969_1 /TAXON_ID=210454 /ORGANISM="Grammatophora oceanica, Strain CCMP 410" /LENGTH=442 /DNA_ID=CAMNT_0038689053 /DNA_START=82 /DNA_END=1410 /DNA_ORIENTATION=-